MYRQQSQTQEPEETIGPNGADRSDLEHLIDDIWNINEVQFRSLFNSQFEIDVFIIQQKGEYQAILPTGASFLIQRTSRRRALRSRRPPPRAPTLRAQSDDFPARTMRLKLQG